MISETGLFTRATQTEARARMRQPLDRTCGLLHRAVELLRSAAASLLLRDTAQGHFEPDRYATEMPFVSDGWPLV
jgi:hypothetical protein